MRIGIFGGSFNPPHNMHLNIALKLIENNYLDKVIYVPAGTKYKYKNNLLPDIDRYNMIKAMIKDYPNIDVSDYELKDNVVYTYETLKYFHELYKNDEIYFVCGADNLDYIDKWKNSDYILNNYKIILIGRNGFNNKELLDRYNKYNVVNTDIESIPISSTLIRDKIKNNEDVSMYMNSNVIKYIQDHNLYKE